MPDCSYSAASSAETLPLSLVTIVDTTPFELVDVQADSPSRQDFKQKAPVDIPPTSGLPCQLLDTGSHGSCNRAGIEPVGGGPTQEAVDKASATASRLSLAAQLIAEADQAQERESSSTVLPPSDLFSSLTGFIAGEAGSAARPPGSEREPNFGGGTSLSSESSSLAEDPAFFAPPLSETVGDPSGPHPILVPNTETYEIVSASTNPQNGQHYSVSFNLTPITIDFPSYRTDGPIPAPVPLTATFLGGNYNPNEGGWITINGVYSSTALFYLIAGFSVGASRPIDGDLIAIRPSLAGTYPNEVVPLTANFGGTSIDLSVAVSAKIYDPAVPKFLLNGVQAFSIDFGIVHIGETVTRDVQIINAATGDLTDGLTSTTGQLGQFTTENRVQNLLPGTTETITISLTGETAGPAFTADSRPLFNFVSHNSDLPDEALGLQNMPSLIGNVYYSANPILVNARVGPNAGTLVQDDGTHWTLYLGTAIVNSFNDVTALINIENDTPAYYYSDALKGSVSVIASPDDGFIQSINSLTSQSAAGGGGFMALGSFSPNFLVPGEHVETIIIHLQAVNPQETVTLPDVTLTVVTTVVPSSIPGASITDQDDCICVAVDPGQEVALSPLLSVGRIDALQIQGPGIGAIDGSATAGTLDVVSGGTVHLRGGVITANAVNVDAGGNIRGHGSLVGDETVNGAITVEGGTLELAGDINGGGNLNLGPGTTLKIDGNIGPSTNVTFGSAGETLVLGLGAAVSATIHGFGTGDTIGVAGQGIQSATYNPVSHHLLLTAAGNHSFDLSLAGTYQQSNFSLTNGQVQWVEATAGPSPTAANLNLYIGPGESADLTSWLLAKATPVTPGDMLTLSAIGLAGTHGSAGLNGGQVHYTAPMSGESDAFTYTVSDQNQASGTGNIHVYVEAGLAKDGSVGLTGSGSFVFGGASDVVMTGGAGGNTIHLGDGNHILSIPGNGNVVSVGHGHNAIALLGSDNTLVLGDTTTALSLQGTGNTVAINGGTVSIEDAPGGGDDLLLQIGALGGNVAVTNFAAGSAEVEIAAALASSLQWSTPQQILAALVSDNHGGTLLSLGSFGTIDFVGVSPAAFRAAGFEIG